MDPIRTECQKYNGALVKDMCPYIFYGTHMFSAFRAYTYTYILSLKKIFKGTPMDGWLADELLSDLPLGSCGREAFVNDVLSL